MSTFKAAYLTTYEAGLLTGRLEAAWALLEACTLCPRRCGVNRLRGEKGFCRAGGLPAISSYGPHFGEERPLVGSHGSGTIFMTHCNLGCIFCQNYSISRLGEGRTVSFDELSNMMVELQRRGCHNINFVSPSHFVPHLMRALPGAIEMAARLSRRTYVNIMDQYHPRGDLIPPGSPLARRITGAEFREAVRMAKEEGLVRIDCELP